MLTLAAPSPRRRRYVAPALVATLALMAGVTFATRAEASTPTYYVPSTIPADCSADVTSTLNYWIKLVPNNAIVSFPKNACYQIGNPTSGNPYLWVSGRSSLTFQGNGTTFKEMTPGNLTRRSLWFSNDSNIVVENFTIIGVDTTDTYNANYAFQSGIEFDGVQTGTINHVTIENVYGDFVTLDPYGAPTGVVPDRNILVENSTFNGAGRQGISFDYVVGAEVLNNSFTSVALDTFDMESDYSTEGAWNILIQGNTSTPGPGQHELWFANQGKSTTGTGNITVKNNVMTGYESGDVVLIQPPSGATRGPFTFTGNSLDAGDSAYVAGFEIYGCTSCSITGNTVQFITYPGANKETGAHFTGSTGSFSSNVLHGVGTVLVSTSSTVTSTSNTVTAS